MATPGDDNTAQGQPRPPKKAVPPPPNPPPESDPAEDEMTIRRASPARPPNKPAPAADAADEATLARSPPAILRSDSPPTPGPAVEEAAEDATIPNLARAAAKGVPARTGAVDEDSKYEEESTRRSSAASIPPAPQAPAETPPVSSQPPTLDRLKPAPEPAAADAATSPSAARREGGNTLGYQGAAAPPPSEISNALAKLRPKLLVVLGGTKQIHEITPVPYIVGRDPQVNCRIQHDTVSGSHAIIDFDGKSFTIEDLGSKNSSKLGNAQLKKGQKYELPPESGLRFAAAEALFFLENPEELQAARALQGRAADILVRDGKVTREQKRDAARGSRPETAHPGARLVLEADLRPSDWSDAARRGREGVGKGVPLWFLLAWLLLALAVGTAVGWFLYMKG